MKLDKDNHSAEYLGNQLIEMVSSWMKHPSKSKTITSDMQILVRGMLWHTRLSVTFQKGDIFSDGAYADYLLKRKKSRKTKVFRD